MIFDEFFQRLTHYRRHDWQARVAVDDACKDRLIRIPTGFGKTAGVTIAWLWNRVHRKNDAWPRRLVLCLPMRTLVEQTERTVSEWISKAELDSSVKVHVLMGGLSLSGRSRPLAEPRDARVDINPQQFDAALFTLRPPYSKRTGPTLH